MIERASEPRRGPEATGYRVSDLTRRQLDLARGFTGARSNQELIDRAVIELLEGLRQRDPHFRAAAEALDAYLANNS